MKKSQASLEATISFLVVLTLFLGIMVVWVWTDHQIAKRQPDFNGSRLKAGNPDRTPEKAGGDKKIFFPVNSPDELNDSEVTAFSISN